MRQLNSFGTKIAKIVLAIFVIVSITSALAHAQTHVRGYFRKNGTYVQPHWRSTADGNFYNNWSTYPNVNPYTGKRGTRLTPPAGYSSGSPVFGHSKSNSWNTANNSNPYNTQRENRVNSRVDALSTQTLTQQELEAQIAALQEQLRKIQNRHDFSSAGSSIVETESGGAYPSVRDRRQRGTTTTALDSYGGTNGSSYGNSSDLGISRPNTLNSLYDSPFFKSGYGKSVGTKSRTAVGVNSLASPGLPPTFKNNISEVLANPYYNPSTDDD